ncbi:MAG: DoxX family protein [Ignavibacteriales bacterium]|nr:DoxX family protein [Ignavibacteriales bacterium]
MKLFSIITNWLNTNSDVAYSIIRIFLGTALFVRGAILASDPATLTQLAGSNQYYWWYSYIIVIHIICGFFMAIGFVGRIAALLQIPILFGAVFFLHLQHGLATVEQSLELSALVLVLLITFFLFGSGAFSVDNYIAKRQSIK